ncbi:MAG: hypothetical protein U0T77_10740 [Chitinophagales bacterium]
MEVVSKFSDITPDNISEWKQNKKKVSQVSIPVSEDDVSGNGPTAEFVVCQPDRNVLDVCARASQEKNFRKANSVMLNSCVLGGDMKYIKPDGPDYLLDVELALLDEIGKLIESKKAIVKKL